MATFNLDARMLAGYGIVQTAHMPLAAHLETRYGIRNGFGIENDYRGILQVTAPVAEMDSEELHGLLELACAVTGAEQPLCDKDSVEAVEIYIAMMRQCNRRIASQKSRA
jgi:hypothetical protein